MAVPRPSTLTARENTVTVWYCKDSPTLHVGDDTAPEVVFRDGFAEIPLDDPNYEVRAGWLNNETGYAIENLGEETEQVPEGTGFPCDVCGRSFSTAFALRGHLRSHKR